MIKLIKNVLTLEDCFSLYDGLINQDMWNLNRFSTDNKLRGCFPGVVNNFLSYGGLLNLKAILLLVWKHFV